MRQFSDIPQDKLVKSTGRCSDQQRSGRSSCSIMRRQGWYLFTAFSPLRRGGLMGNGDGYLTLEAERLITSRPLFLSLLVEMQ